MSPRSSIRQGNGEGSRCQMPGMPPGTARELRAYSARRKQCQLHRLPQRARGEDRSSCSRRPSLSSAYGCHTETKPQFSMPFHHKVEEGLMKCTDCHDPHGTFDGKNLRAPHRRMRCAPSATAETAGPFVYEHEVVKTEGCTACHIPHGGPNPRLLNRANVNTPMPAVPLVVAELHHGGNSHWARA